VAPLVSRKFQLAAVLGDHGPEGIFCQFSDFDSYREDVQARVLSMARTSRLPSSTSKVPAPSNSILGKRFTLWLSAVNGWPTDAAL
jgi:hypothetical protein